MQLSQRQCLGRVSNVVALGSTFLCCVLGGVLSCQEEHQLAPLRRYSAFPGVHRSDSGTVCTKSFTSGDDSAAVSERDVACSNVTVQRALLISIDGLGGGLLDQRLSEGKLPNFAALRQWGASTTEARSDFTYTTTLPDHTSMLTGRPVSPIEGLAADVNHGYYADGMPAPEETLHNAGNPNLSYIASIFDVAHDHGLRTCLYAGKAKFILFSRSYDARHGAPDRLGADNGRDKIDRSVILENQSSNLVALASADLEAGECDFAFVHVSDMDATGHQSGWGSDDWWNTL